MTGADPHLDVAGHALGVLDAADREAFETHLAGCAECRADLTRLRPVVATLAAAAVPLPVAPPDLEGRTLMEIARASGSFPRIEPPAPPAEPGPDFRRPDDEDTAQAPPEEAPAPEPLDAVLEESPAPEPEEQEEEAAEEPPAERERTSRGPLVALGSVALLAAGFFAGSLVGGGDAKTTTVTRTATATQTVPVRALVGDQEFVAILDAVDGGGASAAVNVVRADTGREILVDTSGLPRIGGGEVYELWFVAQGTSSSEGNRISAGTFRPGRGEDADVYLNAAVNPVRYPRLAITRERADGNPAPTLPDGFAGELTRP